MVMLKSSGSPRNMFSLWMFKAAMLRSSPRVDGTASFRCTACGTRKRFGWVMVELEWEGLELESEYMAKGIGSCAEVYQLNRRRPSTEAILKCKYHLVPLARVLYSAGDYRL